MISRRTRSAKLLVAVVAGAFTIAACGGSDSGDAGGDAAGELPAVAVPDEVALDPVADIETNLLPDLVVDNLNDDNKVNLRNFGVGDKPILLWMYAPH